MATGNFVGYYRVSTSEQGRSGLGLEAQRQAVHRYLDGGDWRLIGEHTEIESGKIRDRPQLKAALEQCKLTGATLIIAKLDRLSRNVAFLAALMDSEAVPFVACDNPHATRLRQLRRAAHGLAAGAQPNRAVSRVQRLRQCRPSLRACDSLGVRRYELRSAYPAS